MCRLLNKGRLPPISGDDIYPYMRILVDVPQEQIDALDTLSRAERRSRASIIREAVSDYMRDRDRAARRALIESGVGLWKDRDIDGLAYQEAIRAEWDRDPAA